MSNVFFKANRKQNPLVDIGMNPFESSVKLLVQPGHGSQKCLVVQLRDIVLFYFISKNPIKFRELPRSGEDVLDEK